MKYQEYYDKVHGGWIGRVAGSHLGAPMEFRPYSWIQRKYCDHGKRDITGYVRPVNPMAVNDDELFQIVGLIALEKHGANLTASDIAQEWKVFLDKKQYLFDLVPLKNIRLGIPPPECAAEKNGNFYYDAIQGQMKADVWGLLTPNCPDLAAYYAEMDGSLANWGSGIDAQVFVATLISNAFGISDIGELLRKSLQVLSPESSYRRFIEVCMSIKNKSPSWREGRKALVQAWHEELRGLRRQRNSIMRRLYLRVFPNIQVLPNGGIIVLSLLYGQDQDDPFGRSLCIGAMMGYDTDCNCGNIGTIMGAILGEKRMLSKWKDPLQNQFHTKVRGHEHWTISDLSAKICAHGVKILEAKCPDRRIEGT